MMPDLMFRVGRVAFSRGSSLLLYADGVTEAEAVDATQFGEEEMQRLLADRQPDVAGTVQGIVAAVDDFAAAQPRSDDITRLLIRRC